ncbi:Putative transcription regulator Rua1 [Septoria linicola]|uniref:Transcription regulator Rua1 n=1 Tax=Septoria linicola TaxID=215465 RepID=A0A9Q9EFH1_9PEZI|nr:putative transcription regulator Rua1 [Septoria linicola]USW47672.1 Putative transcription regulator Rua1 [Septoria linicola]
MSFPNGSWDAWYGSPAWPEFSNRENAIEQVSEQPTRLHDSESYVSSQYTYDYPLPHSGYHDVRHASVPSTSHYLPTCFQAHAAHQERITPAVIPGADRMQSMPQQVQQSGQQTNHDSQTMEIATPSTPDFPLDTISDTIMTNISFRSRSDPTESDDPDEPTPRRQTPRFAGDEYTARWVRGEGVNRAGWCGMCSSWHRLKDSAYWYHMHYSHGISCATGKPFRAPLGRRSAQGAVGFEAQCGCCNQWVYIGRLERFHTPYFRHAYKCLEAGLPALRHAGLSSDLLGRPEAPLNGESNEGNGDDDDDVEKDRALLF